MTGDRNVRREVWMSGAGLVADPSGDGALTPPVSSSNERRDRMNLKALAPFGIAALVCVPCLAVGLGAGGVALASVTGALVTPVVGIPLLALAVLLIALGAVWAWRRSRACPVPQNTRGRGAPLRSTVKR